MMVPQCLSCPTVVSFLTLCVCLLSVNLWQSMRQRGADGGCNGIMPLRFSVTRWVDLRPGAPQDARVRPNLCTRYQPVSSLPLPPAVSGGEVHTVTGIVVSH